MTWINITANLRCKIDRCLIEQEKWNIELFNRLRTELKKDLIYI